MSKDYRRLYAEHLGRTFDRETHVHHIDHNPENNCFSNLVAIPRDLHGRYHFRHRDYMGYHKPYGDIKMPSKATQDKYNLWLLDTPKMMRINQYQRNKFIDKCHEVHFNIILHNECAERRALYLDVLKVVKDIKKAQIKEASQKSKLVP